MKGAVADSVATDMDQLDSISDATEQQHAALRAAIEERGGHDLLPYFFGEMRPESERKQFRYQQIAEQKAAKRAANGEPPPKPRPARKPPEPPLPTKHHGRSAEAKALRARMREYGRAQGIPVDNLSRPNKDLARMYYAAHPEEAS